VGRGDAANLYRTEGGKYAVIDDEGNCAELAPDRDAWRKTNRRIFARVKNAKTKPIERFFSSFEQILRDMCLPGFVREMGASAPKEEEAKRRLKWQQKNNLILSYEEFVRRAARAIDLYQRRRHGSLRGCPLEELQDAAERQGFRQVFFSPGDVAYLFFDRQFVKVQGDRLRLQNQRYSGPPLTQEIVLENRGSLVGLDHRKVEARFDPDNPDSGAFALDPRDGKPIVLRRVEGYGIKKRKHESGDWRLPRRCGEGAGASGRHGVRPLS
jgi:putative transposase